MTQWINGVLSGAPVWVWPLLVLLIFVGVRASRPRRLPIAVFYGLPLLGLMSVNGLLSLPNQAETLAGYAMGYLLGILVGYWLQARWLLAKDEHMVSLAGEWFTLLTVMLIFWMNFAGGMAKAISPDTYARPEFSLLFGLAVGWAAGTFLGRVLRVVFTARGRAAT